MAKANPSQSAFITFNTYEALAALPEAEQPQARLLRCGPMACSLVELLQVIIGGAHAERAARNLLEQCHDLRGIATKSIPELVSLAQGIGPRKALLLKASLELGRRMFAQASDDRLLVKTPADAAQLLMPEMGLLEQEEVRTVMLDSRNRVIGIPMIYRGSLNAASLRVGEVFREAIRHNAASIIVAHNHPSQDPSPSADDVVVTKELIQAGKLLDVEVLDHVVLGGTTRYVSLKERGLAFE